MPTETEPPRADGRREVSHRAAAGEGDRLRAQLLEAAERQLIERGNLAAVSLRQVARDVGCSPTAVYLHFSDKDDLFLACCQARFEALAQIFRDARKGVASPSEQLRASGRAYVEFGLDHPELYALLFGGAVPMEVVEARIPEEERVGLQILTELAEVVAAGVASGEFRAVDPFEVTVSLWAVVHGLVEVMSHGTGRDDEVDATGVTETALGMVLNGLRA